MQDKSPKETDKHKIHLLTEAAEIDAGSLLNQMDKLSYDSILAVLCQSSPY